MVIPINCMGRPYKACMDNKTVLNDFMPDDFLIADNYLEVADMIMALKSGISFESVRRPFLDTVVME